MNAQLKTILCTLAVVLLSYLPAAAGGGIYYDFKYNGVYYNIISGTNEVYVNGIDYLELPEHLVIPDTVKNSFGKSYVVTQVGSHGFKATNGREGYYGEGYCVVNDVTTSVTLPGTITSIHFRGLENITEITFPASVVKLTGSLGECKLLKEATLPSRLNDIGESMFEGCGSLEKVRLPASLKSIGKQAFNNCLALVSIDMPDSVKVINDYAFGGCIGLKSVNFSEKSQLEKLCYGAFGGCTALEQFDFPSSLKEIGGAFVGSGLRNVVVPERMANNDIRFSGCPELRSSHLREYHGFELHLLKLS